MGDAVSLPGPGKVDMKLRTVLLGFVLGIALSPFCAVTKAHGQAAILVALFGDKVASENFYFSLKGGLNFSNLDAESDTNFQRGPNFGMLANIRLGARWGIVPEFQVFSIRGAEGIPLEPTGNSELDALLANTSSSESRVNYIDVPVVVQYRPHSRWQLGVGAQVSYLKRAQNIYRAKVFEDEDLTYQDNVKDSLNNWDWGVLAEAGFVLLPTQQGPGLTLHIRYAQGLTDIVRDNPGDPVRTSMWQFSLSLPFLAEQEEAGG
jgi:hypothetical protein